jgi:uncharacterized protein
MARPLPSAALTAHLLLAALVALLIGAGFAAGSANAQSFECRYAHYPDEKTICHDQALGQLDQELASVYRRVMLKLPRRESEALDKNEDAFVIARRRCGDHRACIEQSYRNRIQELQAALPEDESDRRASRQAPKRSDRHKTEDERDEAGDGKRGAVETAISSPERKSDQGESGAATAVAPGETRSRQEETTSTVSNPPSRREAQAALADVPLPKKRSRHKESAGSGSPAALEEKQLLSATAVPERLAPASGTSTAAASSGKPPEKRHSAKTVSRSTPAPPGPPKTTPTGGTQWVNPSPSP